MVEEAYLKQIKRTNPLPTVGIPDRQGSRSLPVHSTRDGQAGSSSSDYIRARH